MPSSVIRSYEYDASREELRVLFQSGWRYVYHRVPLATYVGLKEAFSKGMFFNSHIRDCFAFTRLD
jgi:hypothetical protein